MLTIKIFWRALLFYYSDVCCWDLADVVSSPFLTSPRAPMSTRTVVVFGFLVFSVSVSRSLHFESFSTVFIEVLFFIADRYINERPSSLLLVFHYYVWPVCLDLFVCLDWHVPEYSHCVVFRYCRLLMFVVFVLHFDAIVLQHIALWRSAAALLCLCTYSVLA